MNEGLDKLQHTVNEIRDALLGELGGRKGLMEETRAMREDLDLLRADVAKNKIVINDLSVFKSDAKKIIAGIALVVPILFELLKLGFVALIELVKNHK